VDYRPAGSGAFILENELVNLKRIFWRNNIVAFTPFLYVPATVDGRRAVLIGTWFEKPLPVDKSEVFTTGLKKLHPAWQVEGAWPDDQDAAGVLVGRRLAARLKVTLGSAITVEDSCDGAPCGGPSRAGTRPAPTSVFHVRGVLQTGEAEDEQVLAPLATAQHDAGVSRLWGKRCAGAKATPSN
jgi:putative ABC transport system permease protein